MKKRFIFITLAAILASCSAPAEMQLIVTPLGEEVPESTEQGVYVLPQTILKVELTCQEVKSVPGPFRDYAQKYLSIKEVINQNSSQWQILDMKVVPYEEMDPGMAFQLHLLKGDLNMAGMDKLVGKGMILDGSDRVLEGIKSPAMGVAVRKDYVQYRDLGIASNFEERTETMYKTIVTDTSFVEVPVNRTITEQKSLSKKAEEAAEFILELRTRRFELLTGEYDSYPQGEAMKATLDKLDEMEASYLSLFTGKTLSREETRSWFIVPESGSDPTSYPLGVFSEQLGFIPQEMLEGVPLRMVMTPIGKTRNLDSFYSDKVASDVTNMLYYRIPDVVEVKLLLGNTELANQRISVYQSGALVASPINTP